MHWTRLLGLLAVVFIVAGAVGGLVSLASNTFDSGRATVSLVVIALVVVSVLVTTGVGAKSRRWIANTDYYW